MGESAGFSGAVIVHLETARGPFCLRGWPAGALPQRRILGLHRLLRHVFEAGFSEVAVPVPALNGETLVRCHGRLWQLEPWLPGRANYWFQPSPKKLQNAMSRLAAFHRLTCDYTELGPAAEWFYHREHAISPAVTERFSCLQAWRQSKLSQLKAAMFSEPDRELRELAGEFAARFESVALSIATQLDILSHTRFRLQPCLRDVWHDHVLFAGEEVTGLIDASACRAENVATDLARLLGSLLKDDRPAWEFAVQEYESHRPLDSHERALVQALDHSGVLLSGMAWMDRLLLHRETVPNRPKVWERLETLRLRLKTLEESINRNLRQL